MTESQKKATKKYKKSNYEKICIEYKKGTRDLWKTYAENAGCSLAEYIKRAVEAYYSGGKES